jgi:Sec-independent protein translocase protein TatA
MEIFNVGPWELGLILILALIVLGPDRMVKTSREVARWIAKIVRSPIWKDLVNTSEEVRSIPKQLIKEANLEKSLQEINELTRKPFVTLGDSANLKNETPNSDSLQTEEEKKVD